jgi:hypothetical protein
MEDVDLALLILWLLIRKEKPTPGTTEVTWKGKKSVK